MNVKSDTVAKMLLFFGFLVVTFAYGVLSHRNNLFPVPQIREALSAGKEILSITSDQLPWYYVPSKQTETVVAHAPETSIAPGLTMISSLEVDNKLAVKIIDREGTLIHYWDIDWFKIWPDPSHLPDNVRPKSKLFSPGTRVAGMVLMDNGDLVFNFEKLGMVRANICGDVVWRLPYQTHHSIHLDESGNFWVSGDITHAAPVAKFPNYRPPFAESTVLEVSPDGEILTEISLFDLLIQNELSGLLYMYTITSDPELVSNDTLHLNDVETFPSSLQEGVFKRGDVMVSLRNINAVIVFDPQDMSIRYNSIGNVLRQHDPDFIDGNTFTVFDNNNLGTKTTGHSSRIVAISADDNRVEVAFTGTEEKPFFTNIMGKHQWLPNDNLLLTESNRGRAFEIEKDGTILWEYFNIVDDNVLGIIDEAQRLGPRFDPAFFDRVASTCPSG